MPMNLTQAPDHPSTVLKAESEQVSQQQRWQASEALIYAAGALRDYEADRDVTFAALDNDALAEVQRAYAAYQAPRSGPSAVAIEHNRLIDLARAVSNLLGLDDESEG